MPPPQAGQVASTDPNAARRAPAAPATGAPNPLAGQVASTDPSAAQRGQTPLPVFRSSVTGVLGQTADAIGTTLNEINPFPALYRLNYGASRVLDDVIHGRFTEGTRRVWDDMKGAWEGLANLGFAHGQLFQEADDAYRKGDYSTMAARLIQYPLLGVGPRLRESEREFAQGNYGKGTGIALGTGINIFGGPAAAEALAARGITPQTALAATVNAARARGLTPSNLLKTSAQRMQEAVDFAKARGIPMTLGQAMSNRVVRGTEQLNDASSITANLISGRNRAQQAEALQQVGADIASQVSPTPTMPLQAGEAVQTAVGRAATRHDAEATMFYDQLRALEAQQAARIAQVGGLRSPSATGAPFTDVPLAVDVAPLKQAMQPIYDGLMRKKATAGTLMGTEARMAARLAEILEGPDLAPLSAADAALSDLKAIARVDHAFQRTTTQGIAATAVKNLEASVQRTAQAAGPNVWTALKAGRKATKAKVAATELFDTLKEEGVGTFKSLVSPKDAAIGKLRELQQVAPEVLPQVGRAFLEDLLTTARKADSGFGNTGTIGTAWQDLGPETKRLLFRDPAHVAALDNFFQFAKQANAGLNPSGSALLGTLSAKGAYLLHNPAGGVALEIGQGALAQALWSPRVVRLLTQAMKTPMAATGAARRLYLELSPLLGPANTMGQAATAAADQRRPEEQRGQPRAALP
jgi:hypothetical protein